MKHTRVKVDAHAYGVGFYSYMCAWLSPIPTESVDEVISPRFFLLSKLSDFGLLTLKVGSINYHRNQLHKKQV